MASTKNKGILELHYLELLASHGRELNNPDEPENDIFYAKRRIHFDEVSIYNSIIYGIYEYSLFYPLTYLETIQAYSSMSPIKYNDDPIMTQYIEQIMSYFAMCLAVTQKKDYSIDIDRESTTNTSKILDYVCKRISESSYMDGLNKIFYFASLLLNININFYLGKKLKKCGNLPSLTLYYKYAEENLYLLYPSCYGDNLIEDYFIENYDKAISLLLHCGHPSPYIAYPDEYTLIVRINSLKEYKCPPDCTESPYEIEISLIKDRYIRQYGKRCALCGINKDEGLLKCNKCSCF